MNNFLLESLIPISTIENKDLLNMTNISKTEQDPTVDERVNRQWPWLACRQCFLELYEGYISHTKP